MDFSHESCSVKGRGPKVFAKALMLTASSAQAHGKLKHQSILSVKTALPQIPPYFIFFFSFFPHQTPRKSVSSKENPIRINVGTESRDGRGVSLSFGTRGVLRAALVLWHTAGRALSLSRRQLQRTNFSQRSAGGGIHFPSQ